MQKGEFFPAKFAGIVVLRESKKSYPPVGAKKFWLDSTRNKEQQRFQTFGAKQGAKKSIGKKFNQFN